MSATIPSIHIRNLRQEEGEGCQSKCPKPANIEVAEASNPGLLTSNPRLFVLHQTTSLRFYCEDVFHPNVKISSKFSLYVWGSYWLHFGLSKLLFFPASIPRNIHSKNERVLPLNSLVEEKKKWFSFPFLDSQVTVETQRSLGSPQLLSSVCFILSHTP